jgi:hypothetical protein
MKSPILKIVYSTITLALVMWLSACGRKKEADLNLATTNPAHPLYQTWATTPIALEGGSFHIKIKIDPGTITFTNTCKRDRDGFSLKAVATARAEIDSKTIKILEAKENTLDENGMKCSVSIQTGESEYLVNGNILTLSREGKSFTFQKE